jgi:serine/threonine-protein kinase
MLAGSPPFTGDSAVAVALAHGTRTPPSLAGLRPEVGPELDSLVGRALAKDPAARFASAAELDAALAAAVTGAPVPAPDPGPSRRSATSRAMAPVAAAAAPGRPDDPGPVDDPGATRGMPVAGTPGRAASHGPGRGVLLAVAVVLALAVGGVLVGAALGERARGPGAAQGSVPATVPTVNPAPVATSPAPLPTSPPPSTTAPPPGDPGLDALVTTLEADPDRYGERGEDLLDRLRELQEAEADDVPRLATETVVRVARWTRRDELDPAIAAETARVLAGLAPGGPPAVDGDEPQEDDDD